MIDFVTNSIRIYFNMGGPVLYFIAALAFLMWTLIIERMWFFMGGSMRKMVNDTVAGWQGRTEHHSWHAHKIRDQLISEVRDEINDNMSMIKTTVSLAPLFGLLGTVTGMINVFAIMAITGGGDARLMAAGVFSATIPTLSGMVVAISGVFASNYLTRVSTREAALFEDHLELKD